MFTTFTRTTICTLIVSLLMAANANAQLNSVFGGNPSGSGRSPNTGAPIQQNPMQQSPIRGGMGQSPAPLHQLVGNWYISGDVEGGRLEMMYAFQADASMMLGIAKTASDGQTQTKKFAGRYQVNGNSLQIRYDDGDVENYQFQLNGDRLTITSEGSSYVFNRVQPAGPTGVQNTAPTRSASPHAGNWVLFFSGNGSMIQGQLNLNPNGTYSLSINASGPNGTNQTALQGRWNVEGSMIVFETDGEIERLPMQFDGQRLGIDLAEWNVRMIFARDVQNSSVQPLGR